MKERRAGMVEHNEILEKMHEKLEEISAGYGEILTMQDDVKILKTGLSNIAENVTKIDIKLFNGGNGYIKKFEDQDKCLEDKVDALKKDTESGFKSMTETFQAWIRDLLDKHFVPIKKRVGKNTKKIWFWTIAIPAFAAGFAIYTKAKNYW